MNNYPFKKSLIEAITPDNWRPGMPRKGWIVRYGWGITGGWKFATIWRTEKEAVAFAFGVEA